MPRYTTYRPKRTPTFAGGPEVLGNSEKRVALQLKAEGVPFTYETEKLKYHVAKDCTYTPDFKVGNGTFIEVKGLFTSEDRVKHLLIKAQHPEADIRFLFDNANKPINKGSKTTYGAWAEKHGFQYATKIIPKEWLNVQTL
jgi:hypothetical protein